MTDENIVENNNNNISAAQHHPPQPDPELEAKHKTLSLLTHGIKCTATENGRFICTFPHCKAAKTMLQHVVVCLLPPGYCTVPFCAMAKFVLANSSDIQVQMAKANKRGRDFQRTLLSNHKAMTASVKRTRSRSTSRGPGSSRKPLATVYESNDEDGDGGGGGGGGNHPDNEAEDDKSTTSSEEEENVTPAVDPVSSPPAVKTRIPDGSADTEDTDSSEEETSDEEVVQKRSRPASTLRGNRIIWPREKAKEQESSESSDDDDQGFGVPGSFSESQKGKGNIEQDSSDDDDDDGFGPPRKSMDRPDDGDQRVGAPGSSAIESINNETGPKRATSRSYVNPSTQQEDDDTSDSDSSDDEDAGFGVPDSFSSKQNGVTLSGADRERDSEEDNNNTVEALDGSDSVPGNPVVQVPEQVEGPATNDDGWSSDEDEELKAALAKRDIDRAQQLLLKQSENQPSDTCSADQVENQPTGTCSVDQVNVSVESNPGDGSTSQDKSSSSAVEEALLSHSDRATIRFESDEERRQNHESSAGTEEGNKFVDYGPVVTECSSEEADKQHGPEERGSESTSRTGLGQCALSDASSEQVCDQEVTGNESIISEFPIENQAKSAEPEKQNNKVEDSNSSRMEEGKTIHKQEGPSAVADATQPSPEGSVTSCQPFEHKDSTGDGEAADTFHSVFFKTVVGSLRMLKDVLKFTPTKSSVETEAAKLTLSWLEVSKHKVTPKTHQKHLLKFLLTSGKSLTFEFNDRNELIKARKLVTLMLREFQATATSEADPKASATTAQSEYKPVLFRSMVGSLVLEKDSLVYMPTESQNNAGEAQVVKFTLSWDEVCKHKVTPATHEKHLLKFLLTSEKALTFELNNRVDLVKARKEITQLLQDHQSAQ